MLFGHTEPPTLDQHNIQILQMYKYIQIDNLIGQHRPPPSPTHAMQEGPAGAWVTQHRSPGRAEEPGSSVAR